MMIVMMMIVMMMMMMMIVMVMMIMVMMRRRTRMIDENGDNAVRAWFRSGVGMFLATFVSSSPMR